MKEFTKIYKSAPFEFTKITDDHPLYGRLLAREISKLDSLPDFSEDKGLFIFLICSADKRSVFEKETTAIRVKHKLNTPWKELGYKDLHYGPIKRALDEILDISDRLIHGLLLTVSIDKNIESVFGINKKSAQSEVVTLLQENNLGLWKGNEAEKLLRVCHPIALFLSILAENGQKILWLCDHDSINEEGKCRDFSHTQKVLANTLSMYSDNRYEILGFAKAFSGDAGTGDLLSLADFSAGAIQEVLQSELTGKDVKLSDEKGKIIKWMGTDSQFLKKVNLVFVMQDDGDWGVGSVELTKKGVKKGGRAL